MVQWFTLFNACRTQAQGGVSGPDFIPGSVSRRTDPGMMATQPCPSNIADISSISRVSLLKKISDQGSDNIGDIGRYFGIAIFWNRRDFDF